MRLSGQFQANLFFLRKDFACTKTCQKQKLTNKTKLYKQKTNVGNIFSHTQKLLRGRK